MIASINLHYICYNKEGWRAVHFLLFFVWGLWSVPAGCGYVFKFTVPNVLGYCLWIFVIFAENKLWGRL